MQNSLKQSGTKTINQKNILTILNLVAFIFRDQSFSFNRFICCFRGICSKYILILNEVICSLSQISQTQPVKSSLVLACVDWMR